MQSQRQWLISKRKFEFKEDEIVPEWKSIQRAATKILPYRPSSFRVSWSKKDIQTIIKINLEHNETIWLLNIPTEVFYRILEFVPPSVFPSLHLVCHHLHQVMSTSWIWKKLWIAQGWREEEDSSESDHYTKCRHRFLMKGTTEANWMSGKYLSRDLSLKFPERTLFPSTTCHLSDDYIVCGHHTIDSDFHLLVINHSKEIISSAQIPYESSSSIYLPNNSKDIWYSIPNQNGKCLLWNVLSRDLYNVNITERTQNLVFDIGKICYTTSTSLSVIDIAMERTRGTVPITGVGSLSLDPLQPNRLAVKNETTVDLWDLRNFSVTHKIGSKPLPRVAGPSTLKSYQASDNLLAITYHGIHNIELFDIRNSSKPLHTFAREGCNLDHFQFDDTKMITTWGNNVGVFNLKTGELATEIMDVGSTLQQICLHKDKLLLVNFLMMKILYFGNWHSLYFPDQQPLKKLKPKIKFNLSFT